MLQFLAVLIQTTEMSGLELAVFFNGSFESARRTDWVQSQLQMRAKINNVSYRTVTRHLERSDGRIGNSREENLSVLGLETHSNERYTTAENLVDSTSMFKNQFTHGSQASERHSCKLITNVHFLYGVILYV